MIDLYSFLAISVDRLLDKKSKSPFWKKPCISTGIGKSQDFFGQTRGNDNLWEDRNLTKLIDLLTFSIIKMANGEFQEPRYT